MWHTAQPIALSFLETRGVNVRPLARVEVAHEELEVAVVVGVDFRGEVDVCAGLVVCDNGNPPVWHKRAADHVVVPSDGVSAQTSAARTTVEVLNRVVHLPSAAREVLGSCFDRPAAQTVRTVVNDNVVRPWPHGCVSSTFVGDISTALARLTHDAMTESA